MIFTTGRTRTLSWSGELAGTTRLRYDLNLNIYSRSGQMSAAVCGCGVSVESTVGALTGTVTVNASNGIASDSDWAGFVADGPTISLAGTWSVSADVEECAEVTALFPDLMDSEGYPTFGGVAYRDGSPAVAIRFFERLRAGGTATATITAGALTATASSTIAIGDVRAAGYALDLEVAGECQNQVETYSLSGGSVAGGWGAAAYTRSETVGAGTATATIGAASDVVTATLSLNAPLGSDPYAVVVANGEVGASAARASTYDVRGRALRWTDTYDRQLTAHVKTTALGGVDVASDASGQWSGHTVTHRVWSATSTLQGIGQSSDAGGTPYTSMRVYLTAASLAAAGEPAGDWRLGIAGKPYRAMRLQHVGPLWPVSGSLAMPAASEGWRYLRVRHRSVGAAGQAWTLTILGKRWDLTTGADGAWVETDLDLCRPDDAAPEYDAQESRYPAATVDGAPASDGPFWGVSRIPAATADGPPELEVDWLRLARQEFAQASFIPAARPWAVAWVSGTDTTHHRPFLWLEADGRIADLPAAFRVVPESGVGAADAHQSIAQTASRIGTLGGWAASVWDGGWDDAYHTGDRYAWWLGGSGFVWRGWPLGAWEGWIDRPAVSELVVWAQPQWDEVSGYPGIGDAWERTDYPVATADMALPIRFTKVLRGMAWGLLFGQPAGTSVELRRESDGALRGAGASSAGRLRYATGAPYGQGDVAHRVEEGTRSLALTVYGRMRHRRVLADPAAGGVHRYEAAPFGATYDLVFGGSGATLRRRDVYDAMTPSTVIGEPVSAAQGAWSPMARRHVVAYVRDGETTVRSRWSYGNESTWTEGPVIGAGTNCVVAARDGEVVAGRFDAGTWHFVRWDRAAAGWVATGSLAGGTAGAAGLEFERGPARGRLLLTYPTAGGIAAAVSDDLGATWRAA